MSKKKYTNVTENIILVIVCIVYVFAIFSVLLLNKEKSVCSLFGMNVNGVAFSGIITAIQIILLLYLVVIFKKKAFTLSVIIMVFHMFFMSTPLIFNKNTASIPGIAMMIAGISSICIFRSYMIKVEKNELILKKLANTDALTDLPNRRALMNTIHDLLNKKAQFALVFIDLDNFKNINDTLGHDSGDFVLSEIVKRWNNVIRKTDFIARQGGDEFALIISNYDTKEKLTSHLKEFSMSMSEPIEIHGKQNFIKASFGVVLCPDDTNDSVKLLRYADTAMYHAKKNIKNKICFFSHEIINVIEKDIEIERQIQNALINKQFFVEFQPQFKTNQKQLRGFETLVRMKTDDGKILSPNVFIPVAEKSKLIIEVERWILENALSSFKQQFEEYGSSILLSVNISTLHLQEPGFINDIQTALEKTGFPASQLEIEITESVFIDSITTTVEKLNNLKKMGIKLALDDFGTGYASLSYLKKLPIDLLKVDKSFIDSLHNEDNQQEFVEAIISMGHILKLAVVSEGVETSQQLSILKSLDCDLIQGYIWGRPMSIDDAKKLLLENSQIDVISSNI